MTGEYIIGSFCFTGIGVLFKQVLSDRSCRRERCCVGKRLFVVSSTCTCDHAGNHRVIRFQICMEIFQSENIIRRRKHSLQCILQSRFAFPKGAQRIRPGRRKRQSSAHAFRKNRLECFGFIVQKSGGFNKQLLFRCVFCLTSKGNICHDAKTGECLYAAFGIFASTQCTACYGHLDHEIGAILQGRLYAQIFIRDGRAAPLYEISTHNDNNIICPGKLTGLFQMILMSVMKRIVFCYDTCNLQSDAPFISFPTIILWLT